MGPPFISATVESGSFKFGTELGCEKQVAKNHFLGSSIVGFWARGASQKILDPLFISATIEASNFKFGIQLGFGV